MSKGFTLIEMLIGLLACTLVVHLTISILSVISGFTIPSIDQASVFELQIKQLLYRTNILECGQDVLMIDNFEIILDRSRIVKKPGYEILLHNVESVHFNCGEYIDIEYIYDGKARGIQIEMP